MKGLAQGHRGNSICLFPCLTCLWTLFQATLTSLFLACLEKGLSMVQLSRQESDMLAFVLGQAPAPLFTSTCQSFLRSKHRSPYSCTSYSGPLEITDHISTHYPPLLLQEKTLPISMPQTLRSEGLLILYGTRYTLLYSECSNQSWGKHMELLCPSKT